MTTEQYEFGRRLREAREQRGLTLQTIANDTKISVSLLQALESGDVARWPPGIYRRAFVREYIAAIGLSPEPLVAEFCRVFGEGANSAQSPTPVPRHDALRLTLVPEPSTFLTCVVRQAVAASIDLTAVAVIGACIAWISNARFAVACGLVALFYCAMATAVLGQSVTLWWLKRRIRHVGGRRALHTATTRERLSRVWRQDHPSRVQPPPEFPEPSSAPLGQAASR